MVILSVFCRILENVFVMCDFKKIVYEYFIYNKKLVNLSMKYFFSIFPLPKSKITPNLC